MSTDLSFLIESSNGNQQFIKEMIQVFLRQTPELMDQLKKESGDWPKFRQTFHKFRPTIKMMGMDKSTELIEHIENLYKSDSPDEERINELLAELEEECKEAYKELREYMEKG